MMDLSAYPTEVWRRDDVPERFASRGRASKKQRDRGAVKHAPHNPRRVHNGFAAPQLDVVSRKEHDIAAQFPDTDFERNPCAR